MKNPTTKKLQEEIGKEVLFQITIIKKSFAISALEQIMYLGFIDIPTLITVKKEIEKRTQQILKNTLEETKQESEIEKL